MTMGDKKKTKKKKLEINKETVQELSDEQLGDVAGGYHADGCGTHYSFRGQRTCDPGPTNPKPTVPPTTAGGTLPRADDPAVS
jgi:natural product precursor